MIGIATLMFFIAAAAGLQDDLPDQTFSGVCPAMGFEQESVKSGNSLMIKFMPHNRALHLKWVDLHVVVTSVGGQVLGGSKKNYAMEQNNNDWIYRLTLDEYPSEMLERDDVKLKYSFTYCVGMDGKPVDCDTKSFGFDFIKYKLKEAMRPCPTECGLSDKSLPPLTKCMGSDGKEYSMERCMHLAQPQPTYCPATPECLFFHWDASPVDCPTDCGNGISMVLPEVKCIGSDGNIFEGTKCAHLPRPLEVNCPATKDCVFYNWEPLPVDCPTDCGNQVSMVLPQVECIGSDGNIYEGTKCAHLPRPLEVKCPATKNCVFYNWEPLPVDCPTDCGNQVSMILPEVECIGSDGNIYEGAKCAHLPRPLEVKCPATMDCVIFYWEPSPVHCPEDCGREMTMVLPKVVCMGDDDNIYGGAKCANLPRPSEVYCPATEACVTFHRRNMLQECPVECGLSESVLTVMTTCMGSDGIEYPSENCNEPPPQPTYCPATAPCVAYYWDPYPVQCPADCGRQASMVLPEVVCMGDDGRMYGGKMCANLPQPPEVYCPETESCVTYSWRAGLVQCPTECGLEGSMLDVPASCWSSTGELVDTMRCLAFERPGAAICPATELCPLPPLKPTCHPIEFKEGVERLASSALLLKFTPVGKDIHRRKIDWVVVHYSIVDASGNVVKGGGQENHRMTRPNQMAFDLTFTHTITSLGHYMYKPGHRLAYSFTYCIEMIDCDTNKYFYSL